jgi:hypothetical protein
VKKEEEKGGRERKEEKETRRAKESASIVWIPAYSNNSDYSQLSFLCLLSSSCFSVQCSDLLQSNGDQLGNVVDREQVPLLLVGDHLRPRYLIVYRSMIHS